MFRATSTPYSYSLSRQSDGRDGLWRAPPSNWAVDGLSAKVDPRPCETKAFTQRVLLGSLTQCPLFITYSEPLSVSHCRRLAKEWFWWVGAIFWSTFAKRFGRTIRRRRFDSGEFKHLKNLSKIKPILTNPSCLVSRGKCMRRRYTRDTCKTRFQRTFLQRWI